MTDTTHPIFQGRRNDLRSGKNSSAQNKNVRGLEANADIIFLNEGLYALVFLKVERRTDITVGTDFPAVLVSSPPNDHHDPVEIFGNSGDFDDWIEPTGGTIVVKSPRGGGLVLITTIGSQSRIPEIVPLGPRDEDAAPSDERQSATAGGDESADVPLEVLLHIEGQGDVKFTNGGWFGTRGGRRRVEGFSIRPMEHLRPTVVEYKAFGPNGRETPWATNAKLCGTRGRSMPLTGFAVRLAQQFVSEYEVIYEGSFFEGGISPLCRNGAPCMSSRPEDYLEAMSVRIVRRKRP